MEIANVGDPRLVAEQLTARAVAVQLTQPATASFPPWFACWLAMEDVAVNRLATSITQLTLCQVTTDEIDAATKLLDKACQKLRGIPDVPPQKIRGCQARPPRA